MQRQQGRPQHLHRVQQAASDAESEVAEDWSADDRPFDWQEVKKETSRWDAEANEDMKWLWLMFKVNVYA